MVFSRIGMAIGDSLDIGVLFDLLFLVFLLPQAAGVSSLRLLLHGWANSRERRPCLVGLGPMFLF